MPTHLLDRRRTTSEDKPDPHLVPGRVHEICGPARRTFALWLSGQMRGPVLWIHPGWQADQPNPQGMWDLTDPGRFLFVAPRRAEDLLWSVEEALRSGAVPLVVADLPGAPGLTPIRRMHLAAEATGHQPTGLILTPGNGGAQGVETRWHMAGAHKGRARIWRLDRRRARTAPLKSWTVTQRAPRSELVFAPMTG